jgi:hypothetical protein
MAVAALWSATLGRLDAAGSMTGGVALEVEEKAGLSGAVAFGMVPRAKISDLVKAFGQNMLEEAADELVAVQAACGFRSAFTA